MMNCSDCQNLLVDYVDDELNEDERRKLESHFAVCAACRRELTDEHRLSDLLHRIVAHAPVGQLVVWPTRSGVPQLRAYRRRLTFVAAGFVAIVVVAVLWHLSPSPPRETTVSSFATTSSAVADDEQFADLEVAIEREAYAARLAASAELLAVESAADHYAAEALQLVAETFPETRAGRAAAQRTGLQSTLTKDSL
jgi:anti-sigma factor RsiW